MLFGHSVGLTVVDFGRMWVLSGVKVVMLGPVPRKPPLISTAVLDNAKRPSNRGQHFRVF